MVAPRGNLIDTQFYYFYRSPRQYCALLVEHFPQPVTAFVALRLFQDSALFAELLLRLLLGHSAERVFSIRYVTTSFSIQYIWCTYSISSMSCSGEKNGNLTCSIQSRKISLAHEPTYQSQNTFGYVFSVRNAHTFLQASYSPRRSDRAQASGSSTYS